MDRRTSVGHGIGVPVQTGNSDHAGLGAREPGGMRGGCLKVACLTPRAETERLPGRQRSGV